MARKGKTMRLRPRPMLTRIRSEIKNDSCPTHLNGHDRLLPHTPQTENEQAAQHDEVRSCRYVILFLMDKELELGKVTNRIGYLHGSWYMCRKHYGISDHSMLRLWDLDADTGTRSAETSAFPRTEAWRKKVTCTEDKQYTKRGRISCSFTIQLKSKYPREDIMSWHAWSMVVEYCLMALWDSKA
jgi:hypothetical protein